MATELIIFGLIAGVGGTGLGGLLSVLLNRHSDRTTSAFLAFAGGVMTSVVCFDLLPEARDLGGIMPTLGGLLFGIGGILSLNRLVDVMAKLHGEALKIHKTPQELYHDTEFVVAQTHHQPMLRAGLTMLVAIALHNVPEGLAVGAGGVHDEKLGLLLAVIIALHNIPEGIAIAAPLIVGGVRKMTAIMLTSLAGAPTVIGTLIGLYFGELSATATCLALAAAAGAMLYVVFGEIIPQAVTLRQDRLTTLITLAGIIVGLFLTHTLVG